MEYTKYEKAFLIGRALSLAKRVEEVVLWYFQTNSSA
jgi:hypothetical protein